MQQKKNIRLLVALALTVAGILLLQLGGKRAGNLAVDKKLFQLADEQEITDVYLQGGNINNHFSYKSGRWHVNNTFLLDQSMRNVFFAILSRLEIRRPVAQSATDSIANFLLQEGIRTTITFAGDTLKDYYIGGNKNLEISWAMDSHKKVPYRVHIPGYQSYVAGIFSVPAPDWRSRFVLQVNFALITAINLSYSNGDSLVLLATPEFFTLPGQQADSTKIAGFLDAIAFLQADQFLTPANLSDSQQRQLDEDNTFAILTIKLSTGGRERISFYHKPDNEPYMLGRLGDGTLCRFKYQRIKGIFKTPEDFD